VVRAVHLGKETGDLSGLENPGALDHLPRARDAANENSTT
jgi:hypothetical protein